jgi:hypothetical protein
MNYSVFSIINITIDTFLRIQYYNVLILFFLPQISQYYEYYEY